VPAEEPSAECFDRFLPRHPPLGGPGALCCLVPLLAWLLRHLPAV